jgi:hypothetical protein
MTKPTALVDPHNGLDLLKNLQAAIEADYLLDPSFYEQNALLGFFGCKQVECYPIYREPTTAFRYQFEKSEQIIKPHGSGDGAQISLNRVVRNQGIPEPERMQSPTVFVELTIHFLSESPESVFESVTEIFGPAWTFNQDRPNTSRRVLSKATHLNGNKEIVYNLGNEVVSKVLKMEFDQNGCLLLTKLEIR